MKQKELLRKIAVFGKKHKLPMNVIIFEFAVVILFCHFIRWLNKSKGKIAIVVVAACMAVFLYNTYSGGYLANKGNKHMTNEKAVTTNSPVSLELTSKEVQPETVSAKILNEREIEKILQKLSEPEKQIKADKYYIRVNRACNCVTIYTVNELGSYDRPVKAMICSTGGLNTPLGVYSVGQKYEFRRLLFNVYGQYATRVVGQILFHSSSYSIDKKDALIAEEFNKLGDGVSHGCIRLTVRDAKWIVDNCIEGTVVEIYDDETTPGPLGKPEMIKVPDDTVWDPTDESDDNPWKKCYPSINGVADRQIKRGTALSYMYGVFAKDTCGNDITDKIEVYGEVDINKPGKYMVVYYVKDLIGKTAVKTAIYTVV